MFNIRELKTIYRNVRNCTQEDKYIRYVMWKTGYY